jgi:hypothetical protein
LAGKRQILRQKSAIQLEEVRGARELQSLFWHRQCLTDALNRRHQNILTRTSHLPRDRP